MKSTGNTREWASVGIGAMISGAMVVVISQFAVVRKARSTPELDSARAIVLEEAARKPRAKPSEGPRAEPSAERAPDSRLLLPAGERQTTSVTPAPRPAFDVEPLESNTGKENLEGPPRVAGAEQLDASLPNLEKAVRAHKKNPASNEREPHVAETGEHATKYKAQGKPTKGQIEPKYRVETAPVNAGFGDLDEERGLGEKFSWGIQKAFNSVDGPQPFFSVDSTTGTFMIGLGWQH